MKVLDLFCGAGGAAMGMHRAGFEVTGVDINSQPRYPFHFIRGDALEADLSGYDLVWASPPCQRHSRMSQCKIGLNQTYPDLIGNVRTMLKEWGGLYIIENVQGAPLIKPEMLCGAMFDLKTYRHRYFESNVPLWTKWHPPHDVPTSKAGHWKPGTFISVAGHCAPIKMAREAMGIDWMTREEMAEAIPPAFSEFLGRQVIEHIQMQRAA